MLNTIFSLVTQPINQNVAIIRISGSKTFKVLEEILKTKKTFKKNEILFHSLHDDKNIFIDDILILCFKKPHSFTGEDVAEIQCHGSIFVVEKIISLLKKTNIIQATPGEFTQQAVLNNKIDLTQAEAINALILADNKDLANQASQNLNKKQSKYIKNIINSLEKITSQVRIRLDYPENKDIPKYSNEGILKNLKELLLKTIEIIKDSKTLIKASEGLKVAIIGLPNVGKSTLLNTLLEEERAIVSDVEGTTRDVVESTIYIYGIKVTLQDTAGVRETNDKLEKMGIQKTTHIIKNADLIIYLLDGKKDLKFQKKLLGTNEQTTPNFVVVNKKDLITTSLKKEIYISAINKEISNLLEKITYFVKTKYKSKNTKNLYLITNNQVNVFEEIKNNIEESYNNLKEGHSIDLVILGIEWALENLNKMLGKKIDKDYFYNLFANFCIGK